jgi:hypothetical protein
MGNTDSLDSPPPGLVGSHHLPPYSILCVTPPRRKLPRERGMLKSPGLLGPQRKGLERPLRPRGVSFHPANKRNRDLIIASIPWDSATSNNVPSAGEWISKKEVGQTGPPQWVYQVVGTSQSTANVLEFRKISHTGRIQATGAHTITIPLEGYEPIRVLAQDKHGATFRLAKDPPPPW